MAVVHRPKYDDWSLPKGKLDPGEGWEEAALREVAEETGLECELGAELAPVDYLDRKGRPKRVRWWAMTAPAAGEFGADPEVDEMRWVPVGEAAALLDYEHDSDLVDEALRRSALRPLLRPASRLDAGRRARPDGARRSGRRSSPVPGVARVLDRVVLRDLVAVLVELRDGDRSSSSSVRPI